jgi:4-amino-4-deoxychorismate lyase
MSGFVLMIDAIGADVEVSDAELEASIVLIDPTRPTLTVADLSASRGDGIFETIGVVDSHAQAIDAHLDRLANSARLLELAMPNRRQWRRAIERATSMLPGVGEEKIKLVLSRGIEGSGIPTAWLHADRVAGSFPERTRGIRVVLLDRGLPSDVAERAPWLLAGAKTLSYAVNMAAIREARRRGADDVIFASSDGYAMEGPTSSLILRIGEEYLTPATDIGILAGTTQVALFDHLRTQGMTTTSRAITVDEVRASDALWLVSSVRLVAPVIAIDGQPKAVDVELTASFNQALLSRTD